MQNKGLSRALTGLVAAGRLCAEQQRVPAFPGCSIPSPTHPQPAPAPKTPEPLLASAPSLHSPWGGTPGFSLVQNYNLKHTIKNWKCPWYLGWCREAKTTFPERCAWAPPWHLTGSSFKHLIPWKPSWSQQTHCTQAGTELVPTGGKSNQNWTGKMSELTFLCTGGKEPKNNNTSQPTAGVGSMEKHFKLNCELLCLWSHHSCTIWIDLTMWNINEHSFEPQIFVFRTYKGKQHKFSPLRGKLYSNWNLYTFEHSQKPIFIQHARRILQI